MNRKETLKWIKRFKKDLKIFETNPPIDVHATIIEAHKEQLKSQIEDLQDQLNEQTST